MPQLAMLSLLLIAIISGSTTCVQAQGAESELPDREDFHLFLLLGQSNMAGRGKVTAEDKVAHPRVLMLNKENQWVPAVDPMHFDKPVAGVGLGRTFGLRIAKANPAITVGLIPCAAGGSPIQSWEPGGFHAQTRSHPYDDAITRAKLALQVGTLKGILWHQGESDSQPGRAEAYDQRLQTLIARLRQDLQAGDVPFIVGQMGQFKARPWNAERQQVDAAHRALPENVQRTAFVGSEGLEHKGDEVHFSSEAYRELGCRYAAAYLELVAPQ